MLRRLTLLLALAAQTACVNSLAGAPHTDAGATTRDHSTIDAGDMDGLPVSNLYEAVERLHPEWIRGRHALRAARGNDGEILPGQAELFIDGTRQGSIDIMKSMHPRDVSFIKFYSASEAKAKFGTSNMTTVIALTTAK